MSSCDGARVSRVLFLMQPTSGQSETTPALDGMGLEPEVHALEHESRILGHPSNPVCCFSMMKQVRLCAVWPMENWLGSSSNQIQGRTTVRESYSCALEQGPLIGAALSSLSLIDYHESCAYHSSRHFLPARPTTHVSSGGLPHHLLVRFALLPEIPPMGAPIHSLPGIHTMYHSC